MRVKPFFLHIAHLAPNKIVAFQMASELRYLKLRDAGWETWSRASPTSPSLSSVYVVGEEQEHHLPGRYVAVAAIFNTE